MDTTTKPIAGAADSSLMERVALLRLRRFARVAAVAEESGSPIWRRLARRAAFLALRDCLLLGLPVPAEATPVDLSAPRRAA